MTKIKFELDGQQVEANVGETIWQVAKRQGRDIPHLCYSPEPDYRPDGNCRACMVEIEGERVLAASCIRQPSAGMKVTSQSERAQKSRKMVVELLLADQPAREHGIGDGADLLAQTRHRAEHLDHGRTHPRPRRLPERGAVTGGPRSRWRSCPRPDRRRPAPSRPYA